MSHFGLHRRAQTDTGVTCPACSRGLLTVRRSCLQTHFECEACHGRHLLSELVQPLSDEDFALLAEVVGDRLSDRI